MPSDKFLYETEITCKDTGEVCKGYNAYLQSEHWKKLRNKRIKWENGIAECSACHKKTTNIQLHHVSYKKLGNERKEDLVALCDECHWRVHHNKAFRELLWEYRTVYSGKETMAEYKRRMACKKGGKASSKKQSQKREQKRQQKRQAAKHRKMYRYATCPNSCHVRKVC